MASTIVRQQNSDVGQGQTIDAGIIALVQQIEHQTTGGASGPAAAEVAPASVPLCTSLSPDSLMAYCQSRLNSLDTQMNGIFSQQEQNAQQTSDVNAIASTLNQLPSPTGTPPTINASSQDIANVQAAYTTAIADTSPSQLSSSLYTDLQAFNAAAGTSPLSADSVSQLTQSLKNYAATLNSNSEMTMITLQSLMSQRQTAVQLTTNLVQSLGEQTSDITKNIGQG